MELQMEKRIKIQKTPSKRLENPRCMEMEKVKQKNTIDEVQDEDDDKWKPIFRIMERPRTLKWTWKPNMYIETLTCRWFKLRVNVSSKVVNLK